MHTFGNYIKGSFFQDLTQVCEISSQVKKRLGHQSFEFIYQHYSHILGQSMS